MFYLTRMRRYILLSLFVHFALALFASFVKPSAEALSVPPIRITLLETLFEDTEDIPPGVVVDIEKKEDIPPVESKSVLLAAIDSRGEGALGKPSKAEKPRAPKIEKERADGPGGKSAFRTPSTAGKEISKNDHSGIKDEESRPVEGENNIAQLSPADVDLLAKKDPAGFFERGDEAVLSLNTKKIEYAPYFLLLKRGIENVWYYPDEAIMEGLGGTAIVRFTVLPDGNIDGISLVTSSGEDILDDASREAVSRAAPFPPFPEGLAKKRLHVVVNFSYRPSFNPIVLRR